MTQGYRASVTVAAIRRRRESMGDVKHVLEAYDDAFNAHDEAALRACYADDAVFTAPGGVELKGPEAVAEWNMAWLNAFPDARANTTNRIVSGEWAAQQATFTGTHTETLASPDGDVPATNKTVTGRAAEVLRVVDGKIVEDHLYFDQMEIFTQLGLVPETTNA
jgi:steroid delta-isomerase-like uncharacterized protein